MRLFAFSGARNGQKRCRSRKLDYGYEIWHECSLDYAIKYFWWVQMGTGRLTSVMTLIQDGRQLNVEMFIAPKIMAILYLVKNKKTYILNK